MLNPWLFTIRPLLTAKFHSILTSPCFPPLAIMFLSKFCTKVRAITVRPLLIPMTIAVHAPFVHTFKTRPGFNFRAIQGSILEFYSAPIASFNGNLDLILFFYSNLIAIRQLSLYDLCAVWVMFLCHVALFPVNNWIDQILSLIEVIVPSLLDMCILSFIYTFTPAFSI